MKVASGKTDAIRGAFESEVLVGVIAAHAEDFDMDDRLA